MQCNNTEIAFSPSLFPFCINMQNFSKACKVIAKFVRLWQSLQGYYKVCCKELFCKPDCQNFGMLNFLQNSNKGLQDQFISGLQSACGKAP